MCRLENRTASVWPVGFSNAVIDALFWLEHKTGLHRTALALLADTGLSQGIGLILKSLAHPYRHVVRVDERSKTTKVIWMSVSDYDCRDRLVTDLTKIFANFSATDRIDTSIDDDHALFANNHANRRYRIAHRHIDAVGNSNDVFFELSVALFQYL